MSCDETSVTGGKDAFPSPVQAGHDLLHSRRAVVRHGVKLAFIAPVLTTFFASEARAFGASFHSCYPEDHACDFYSEQKRQSCCGTLVCKTGGGDPVAEGESGTCKPP